MKTVRIATRKSRLALWQSEHVAQGLRSAHPGLEVELVPMSTRGDELLDRSLAEIGGKGLFLKELETAVLDGRADLAVHSLKDVPAESPAGLQLAAFLPRADTADLCFSNDGNGLDTLPAGATVGTSSLRRASQLKAVRPDLEVISVRGNVETRLQKLAAGQVDAVILAAAGIVRLGLEHRSARRLEAPGWLPAPGQGVITVECRVGDEAIRSLIAALDCPSTRPAVEAERAVVAALGADCRMPLAALARIQGDRLELHVRLGDAEGRLVDARVAGPASRAGELGFQAGAELLAAGGERILSGMKNQWD